MRILHTSCTFQIFYCRWMQLSHKNIKSFHPRSIMCTFHPNILVTLHNAYSLCLLYLVVIFLWFWSPAKEEKKMKESGKYAWMITVISRNFSFFCTSLLLVIRIWMEWQYDISTMVIYYVTLLLIQIMIEAPSITTLSIIPAALY